MIKLKLFALLLAGGVTYQLVLKDNDVAEQETPLTQQVFTSGNFISIAGTIQEGNEILIFAPVNCPKEEAQQALHLQSELKLKGFNVKLTNNVNVSFEGQSQVEIEQKMKQHSDRMNMLTNQAGPYVFIRNQGKANPTLDEIVTAYRAI